jgi:hypothetical protein
MIRAVTVASPESSARTGCRLAGESEVGLRRELPNNPAEDAPDIVQLP